MNRRIFLAALLFAAAPALSPALAQSRVSAGVYPCTGDVVGKVTRMMRTGQATWRCVPDDAGPVRVDTVWLATKPETVFVALPDTAITPTPVPVPGTAPDLTGFTAITDAGAEVPTWVKTGSATVRSEATAPRSPPGVVRITYPAGFGGGSAPGSFYSFEHGTWNARHAYYATWLRVSDNWQGHPTSINKYVHFYICGGNKLFLQGYGDVLTATLSFQGIAQPYTWVWSSGSNTSTSGHFLPNQGVATAATRFERGRWHHVEILMDAGTSGNADGAVTLWLDGVRIAHYTGIGWCTAAQTTRWEGLNHSPTWGGAGGTVASPFWLEFDHVVMMRR